MFTYQRKAHSTGYFSPDRFSSRAGKNDRDEIAINPDFFPGKTDQQISMTLAQIMTKDWQHHHGKSASRGYTNQELADKLKSIGLQPTSTGGVGGKETGARISVYVIPDGPFIQSYELLAATGWRLNMQSAPREGAKRGQNKNKATYTCPSCDVSLWGKPNVHVSCDDCGCKMPERKNLGAESSATSQSDELKPTVPEAVPLNRKGGRPTAASEAQQVLQHHESGKSMRWIAKAMTLSRRAVATIIAKAEGGDGAIWRNKRKPRSKSSKNKLAA
jgi:hypothetical protein